MVNRSKQLIPPIIGGISSFLPTKVSAFCFFSLIYTSCYYLPRTPKPVAITGFQNSDITSDNSKRHWIKTSLASRVSRVRTPDGVPTKDYSFDINHSLFSLLQTPWNQRLSAISSIHALFIGIARGQILQTALLPVTFPFSLAERFRFQRAVLAKEADSKHLP